MLWAEDQLTVLHDGEHFVKEEIVPSFSRAILNGIRRKDETRMVWKCSPIAVGCRPSLSAPNVRCESREDYSYARSYYRKGIHRKLVHSRELKEPQKSRERPGATGRWDGEQARLSWLKTRTVSSRR